MASSFSQMLRPKSTLSTNPNSNTFKTYLGSKHLMQHSLTTCAQVPCISLLTCLPVCSHALYRLLQCNLFKTETRPFFFSHLKPWQLPIGCEKVQKALVIWLLTTSVAFCPLGCALAHPSAATLASLLFSKHPAMTLPWSLHNCHFCRLTHSIDVAFFPHFLSFLAQMSLSPRVLS